MTVVRRHVRNGHPVHQHLRVVASNRPYTRIHVASPLERRQLQKMVGGGMWAASAPDFHVTFLLRVPPRGYGVNVVDLLSHEEMHHVVQHVGGVKDARDLDRLSVGRRNKTTLKMTDLRRGRHGGV